MKLQRSLTNIILLKIKSTLSHCFHIVFTVKMMLLTKRYIKKAAPGKEAALKESYSFTASCRVGLLLG